METPAADWRRERARIPGIGASEAAALFGLHPYQSAFGLFCRLVDPPTEPEEDSEVQLFGHAIEPYLRDWYRRKTGRAVAPPPLSLYRLEGRPYVWASPDNIYRENSGNAFWGVLELKTDMFLRPDDPLPDHWTIQVQQQMLCTGAQWASFAILGAYHRRHHVNDIPRNPEFQELLVETVDRFMFAVEMGSWDRWGGPLDGGLATTEALHRLYRRETETRVQLDPATQEAVREWLAVKSELAALKDRKDLMENQLKAALGSAAVGELPDGASISWRTQQGSTYTVNKPDYRVLRYHGRPRGASTEV